MTSRAVRFPAIPSEPLAFWAHLHKNPTHGFFFGPAVTAPTSLPNSSRLFMSLAEPKRLIRDARTLEKKTRNQIGHAAPRFVGVFGFEAARAFDTAFELQPQQADPLKFPAVWFGEYDDVVEIDLDKHLTVVHSKNPVLAKRVEQLLALQPTITNEQKKSTRFVLPSSKGFATMVDAAKEAIARGDIYQANLSVRFSAPYMNSPLRLYQTLSQKNRSPYACLLKMKDAWIISTSPELLLRVEGRQAATRPIAGTRPRGKNRSDDRKKRGQLLLSPKERAEHIMLVDLERNDLGRVCAAGSVHVSERFTVERYSHVMHIVSEVRGRLAKNKTAFDAVKALFPGGTITGCPKIKAVEIIRALEGVSRGPFYGSAGFFAGNGDAVFNILIRTAFISNRKIHVQAGAGIVADSNPRREYAETLAKARVLLESA